MPVEKIFVNVQSRGVIALPPSVRRRHGLDRPGAQVEIIEREGEIVLRPHLAVPADQAWFWTERWRAMEREADRSVAAGETSSAGDVESFLAELDS